MFFIIFAVSLCGRNHPRTVEWLSVNLILSGVSTFCQLQFWIKTTQQRGLLHEDLCTSLHAP